MAEDCGKGSFRCVDADDSKATIEMQTGEGNYNDDGRVVWRVGSSGEA